ncbi:MAG: hypothetical protein KBD44_01880 [Candidatus Pacebacteria bacterium]|nr:hypothetical protein [Candidatus Paceibacterota bacterium]
MLKVFCWAVFLVFLCAVTPALADKPPDVLFKHVTETAQLVHQGGCHVKSLDIKAQCLIFLNQEAERVWVVLFDKDKNGQPSVTHVILVTDGAETTAWCRQDVCL